MYDKFWIPKGGKLFIYDKARKHNIGAFTNESNIGNKKDIQGFATGLVYSDDIIIEYLQPKNVKDEPVISIEYVVYGYRYINLKTQNSTRSLGGSASCNVNINCPSGNDWQKEKEAVALILVDGHRYCTGSLINTTANDLRPLLLTANHCLTTGYDAISNSQLNHSDC